MDIALLQCATGQFVAGPLVRVPLGSYTVEKKGSFSHCKMVVNDSEPLDLNGKLILSNNSSIKLTAYDANNLTVRFVRE